MSKVVKKVFGGDKPEVTQASPPPPPPTVDTEAVTQASENERKRLRKGKGRASTMLTGSKGVTEDAAVGTTTLLG